MLSYPSGVSFKLKGIKANIRATKFRHTTYYILLKRCYSIIKTAEMHAQSFSFQLISYYLYYINI